MDIRECAHCQERCSSKYCSFCNTKEKRIEMDKANEEHFKKNNLAFYHDCGDYKIDVKHVCQLDCLPKLGHVPKDENGVTLDGYLPDTEPDPLLDEKGNPFPNVGSYGKK